MHAHLLLLAVLTLLVVLALRLKRNGSTTTEVAGDPVTHQALEAEREKTNAAISREIATLRAGFAAELAEIREEQARLIAAGNDTAREMNVITQVLDLHLTADQQRNEQQWPASVCSTGSHLIHRRVR